MTPEQKYSIDYQGLEPGRYQLEFDISDDIFTLWDESEVKKGELRATVGLTKLGSTMELEFDIIGAVELPCDRCLEMLKMPIHFHGPLVVKVSDHPGEDDGEIIWITPRESSVSLAQYIYESIILSLPYERVHPSIEQCNPDMIARFTIATDEDEEEI